MNEIEKNFIKARKTIADVDKEIARLFEIRMKAVKDVAVYKKINGIPVEDTEREKILLEENSQMIEDEEIRSYYVNFQKTTMNISKEFQHKLLDGTRIAFSGTRGAFAEIAVKRIFPDGNPVAYGDFKSAYRAVEKGECECAVLPLENSYEGDVARVMDLTYFGSLFINGVYDLPVEHHLFGTKDSHRSTIKTVISHPQALAQCAEYIEERALKTVEAVNTAIAACGVSEKGDNTLGVICSLEAGHECGLKLLDRKINKDSTNTTRFAVFSRVPRGESIGDENFIVLFTVCDEAGSLSKAISVFGDCGYNLKALKSRPSKDVIWNYYFFLEGEGKLTKESEKQMLSRLSEVCTNVRLVGRYGKEQNI